MSPRFSALRAALQRPRRWRGLLHVAGPIRPPRPGASVSSTTAAASPAAAGRRRPLPDGGLQFSIAVRVLCNPELLSALRRRVEQRDPHVRARWWADEGATLRDRTADLWTRARLCGPRVRQGLLRERDQWVRLHGVRPGESCFRQSAQFMTSSGDLIRLQRRPGYVRARRKLLAARPGSCASEREASGLPNRRPDRRRRLHRGGHRNLGDTCDGANRCGRGQHCAGKVNTDASSPKTLRSPLPFRQLQRQTRFAPRPRAPASTSTETRWDRRCTADWNGPGLEVDAGAVLFCSSCIDDPARRRSIRSSKFPVIESIIRSACHARPAKLRGCTACSTGTDVYAAAVRTSERPALVYRPGAS